MICNIHKKELVKGDIFVDGKLEQEYFCLGCFNDSKRQWYKVKQKTLEEYFEEFNNGTVNEAGEFIIELEHGVLPYENTGCLVKQIRLVYINDAGVKRKEVVYYE